jgi:hypothetical protein
MRRLFALIFLFLYVYNIAGYLAVFSAMQFRIRSEVKKALKASVPESELTSFAFPTSSIEYSVQWIEDHEFRYNGNLYDIVRSHTCGDTTYFACINDAQEEQLFDHLDNHVQRHMGDSGQSGKFDSFKDVFKDSIANHRFPVGTLSFTGLIVELAVSEYFPVEPDVPFLPPRLLSTIS